MKPAGNWERGKREDEKESRQRKRVKTCLRKEASEKQEKNQLSAGNKMQLPNEI
jgi:hypothetical protein